MPEPESQDNAMLDADAAEFERTVVKAQERHARNGQEYNDNDYRFANNDPTLNTESFDRADRARPELEMGKIVVNGVVRNSLAYQDALRETSHERWTRTSQAAIEASDRKEANRRAQEQAVPESKLAEVTQLDEARQKPAVDQEQFAKGA